MGKNARVLLLSILLVGTGCSTTLAVAVNNQIDANMKALNDSPPQIEILDAGQLATVRTIAVVPFRDISWKEDTVFDVFRDHSVMAGRMMMSWPGAGALAAEQFENAFLAHRTLEVLQRTRMARVMDEVALRGLTGEVLPEVLAGIAGADAVLLGSVTTAYMYRSDTPEVKALAVFGVNLRLVDTRNGKILAFGRDVVGTSDFYVEYSQLVAESANRLAGRISKEIRAAQKSHPTAKAPEREDHLKGLAPAEPAPAPTPAAPPRAPAPSD
jgi:curli biogenesis system outer membrane secretion channel CsgG